MSGYVNTLGNRNISYLYWDRAGQKSDCFFYFCAVKYRYLLTCCKLLVLFSLPGQSPGRAIVLPPCWESAFAAAAALAKSFLCDGQGAVRRAILSL